MRSGSDSGAHGEQRRARRRPAPQRRRGAAAHAARARVGAEPVLRVLPRRRALGHLRVARQRGRKTRLFLGPYWAWLLATISALSAIAGVVYFVVVPNAPWTLRGPGLGLSGLSLVLLLATAMSDPGIFRRHTRPMVDDWTWSEVAQSYRPPGTVYCQESEVLIEVRARARARHHRRRRPPAAAAAPPRRSLLSADTAASDTPVRDTTIFAHGAGLSSEEEQDRLSVLDNILVVSGRPPTARPLRRRFRGMVAYARRRRFSPSDPCRSALVRSCWWSVFS